MAVIYILYALTTFITLFHLVLFGSRPSKSFSWLLAIIMLPFFGVFFYILFGINRRKLKFLRLKRTDEMKIYNDLYLKDTSTSFIPKTMLVKYKKITDLITNSAHFLPYDGNNVIILDDGKKAFESIFASLEKAKKFIHIQFYIFEEGELLEKLFQLFKKKIKEGVEIRIIYDAIGSFHLSKKEIKRFRNIGVTIYSTMPLQFGSILFTLNYRNHRKIIVVDGVVGFTGGVNISDKYIKPSKTLGIWDDMHLFMEGPIVNSLHRIFVKDYYFASKGEDLLLPKYFPKNQKKGDIIMQMVAGGPDSDYATIMQQYIILINQAEREICIANPYFIPSTSVLEALKIAALSGVDIKLLIPEKSDGFLVKYSMFSYFEELLSVGVRIYMNKEKFLHSKMIIIDDDIASIGSGNFDNRSFEQNFETNALIYDLNITRALREDFEKDCLESKPLDFLQFKQRATSNKILEGIARIFSPLL